MMISLVVVYMGILIADQRNLGMSMKVEKSTVDQVRKRFEFNKKKKTEDKKKYGEYFIFLLNTNYMTLCCSGWLSLDFEERMKEIREDVSCCISPPSAHSHTHTLTGGEI